MVWTISATEVLRFRFEKTGGAKMTMRIAVWSDPGTPEQKRVRLLFVGMGDGAVETPPALPRLPPGSYQVVAVIMIEEVASGTYAYKASLNGHDFADRSGDVNITPGIDVEPFVHRENLTVT